MLAGVLVLAVWMLAPQRGGRGDEELRPGMEHRARGTTRRRCAAGGGEDEQFATSVLEDCVCGRCE